MIADDNYDWRRFNILHSHLNSVFLNIFWNLNRTRETLIWIRRQIMIADARLSIDFNTFELLTRIQSVY